MEYAEVFNIIRICYGEKEVTQAPKRDIQAYKDGFHV